MGDRKRSMLKMVNVKEGNMHSTIFYDNTNYEKNNNSLKL